MATLTLPKNLRHSDTAEWAAALLVALARDEAAGRRPPRLTEPGLATWERFRGRLPLEDLLRLLFEDGAVTHPIPFDHRALSPKLDPKHLRGQEILIRGWLQQLAQLDLRAEPQDYIAAQARLLRVNTTLARSALPAIKPNHRVLELPGTGGQLAHFLLHKNSDLSLAANFLIAASDWTELALAGIVALDLGANTGDALVPITSHQMTDLAPLREQSFDLVLGLEPLKGGHFELDKLAIWFPTARIVLV